MHVASAAAATSSAACLHKHNQSEQNWHVQLKADLLQMERLDCQVQNAFIQWKQLWCLHAIPNKVKRSFAVHRSNILMAFINVYSSRNILRHLRVMYMMACRDLTAALQDMLGVEDVWFWSQNQAGSRKFVHWASRVLEHRYRRLKLCAFCLMLQRHVLPITSLLSATLNAGTGLVNVSHGCAGTHIRTNCKG